MDENGFYFNLDTYKDDLEKRRLTILNDLKRHVIEIRRIYKDSRDLNYNFIAYFGIRLMELYQHSETDPHNSSSSILKIKTYTKDVIEHFIKWNQSYHEENLGSFFSTDKTSDILGHNIFELRQKHLSLYEKISKNESEYIDIDVLKKPDLNKLYEVCVDGYLYEVMRSTAANWNFTEQLIDECLYHFNLQLGDEFNNLRTIKNEFNEMPTPVLIEFFDDLLKTAKGQSKSIISRSEYTILITSICKNQLLSEPIDINLTSSDFSVIKRLFYDFYEQSKIEYDFKNIPKKEYLKFLGNFAPFKDKAFSQGWINSINPKKQKSTLRDLVIT